jgi:hypothetical protein
MLVILREGGGGGGLFAKEMDEMMLNKEEMWKHEEVNAGSSCADRLTYSAVLCLVYSEIDD